MNSTTSEVVESEVERIKNVLNEPIPVKTIKTVNRSGSQQKLKATLTDNTASSADKGWVQQEVNQIARGARKTIRNPPGKY